MDEDSVLNLAKLFSNGSSQYKNLYGFHNQIYQVTGNLNFMLRIASTSHRSKDAALGENDFLLFLKEKGVSVAAPIKGMDGNYVYELTENNEKWIVSAFEIAKGNDFRTRPEEDDTKLKEDGRMLGKIHRYSKQYKPKNIRLRRQWNESQHLINAGSLFEKKYPELKKKFDEFIDQMNKQPKDFRNYGLIHGDYLFSNYFFENNTITVFDFDECEYSWFIYDIAVCMYYYLLGHDPLELHSKTKEAENIFFNLLSGYSKENTIDIYWFKNMDLFFKMREYVLLSTMSEIPYDRLDSWQKSFFDEALERQLNDKPFVNTDFTRVYDDVRRMNPIPPQESLPQNPNFPRNELGETYGSGLDATPYEKQPDLIKAQGIDGTSGYIRTTELDGEPPRTPEEALAQQANRTVRYVNLYESNGKTIIGKFKISPGKSGVKDKRENN